MNPNTEHFDVVVIGAGIAGLTCAWELVRSGLRVLVADGHDEPGGVVRSRRVDGFLLELGPNSLSTTRPEANQVLTELGLEERTQKRLMRDHTRYVWRNRRLCLAPASPGQFLRTGLLTPGEKVRAAAGLFRRLPPPEADIEAGAWFRPRLGDGAVEALVRPGVAGIYAADVDHISLEATFPRIFESARRHDRLAGVLRELAKGKDPSRAPRALASFDEGLQELPRALADRITGEGSEVALGGDVRLDQSAEGTGDGFWEVAFRSGRRVRTGQVVIATCAGAAAGMLTPMAEPAARILAAVEYAPLAIVHVGVPETQCTDRRDGFGFLTTRDSGVRLLGAIWNDRVFDGRAPDGMRLFTCFYGGEIDPEAVSLSDEALESQALSDLKVTMGLTGTPRLMRITRWPRAIPLFRPGHCARIREALRQLPAGLHLLGGFTGDPSLPGRMEAGLELARRIAAQEALVAV